MHCIDGDYSVYAILPPYNTIHAQLIDSTGKLVKNPAGITVAYQAIADSTGSINKSSIGKTNFWDSVQSLFGIAARPDTGLTGSRMPGANNDPQLMQFESTQNWFTSVGIPITAYDSNGNKNPYPMMRLIARDSGGNVLATTDIVLPISDEMDCSTCHASGSDNVAKPRAGWVNEFPVQRDFKLNILKKHDEMQATSPAFQNGLAANNYNPQGLYATVISNGKPILCAACHASNALGTAGQPDTPQLTTSMHASHALQMDFALGVSLNDSTNRSACYRCHPGAQTRCLRGVMGNSVAADGSLAIQCQDCHGNMSAVGDAARQGWLTEPTCQGCHIGSATTAAATFGGVLRFTSALSPDGTPRTTSDLTFATQADVPAPGVSLYRFSAGHGGLACEACHGSTHAEYPSSHANDNVQSIALQGHAGVISECGSCHPSSDPNLTTSSLSLNGPHGMHPVGASWVSRHSNIAGRSASQCQSCHGMDYKGAPLSRSFASRTSLGTSMAPALWPGFQVGCYSCHSGPTNDNRNPNAAPTVAGGSLPTNTGQPATMTLAASDANNDPLTLWIVNQPANGTVGLNGATATFLPLPGFEGGDSFTVAASDGMTSSNLATVQLQVTATSRPQIGSLLNAASSQPGPIVPGEVLTIYGAGVGPAVNASMFVNSAGMIDRLLADTRVLFDGQPAPILYASANQVNVVAPWQIAASGKTSVNVQVEYGGIQSDPLHAALTAASPAIFPGAVVNAADGTVNSPATPAARGAYLTLYASGGGLQNSLALDGSFSASPLSAPLAPVSVQIGGVDSPVTFAGDAPGLVSGVLQINVQVPANLAAGNAIPLVLTIGGSASPPMNIAVK